MPPVRSKRGPLQREHGRRVLELAPNFTIGRFQRLEPYKSKADLERWHKLSDDERSAALARARRRVDAVVPHPSLDFGV